MTSRDFLGAAQENAIHHGSTYQILLRVIVYSLGLLGCLWVAGAYFGDTYLANLGLFMSFATVVELLWAGTARANRTLWYLVCVSLMVGAGFLLTREAGRHCQAGSCHPEAPARGPK